MNILRSLRKGKSLTVNSLEEAMGMLHAEAEF